MLDAFAARWNMAGEQEYEAAQRIDFILFPGEPRVDRFGKLFQLDPGVGLPKAVLE